MEPIDTGTPVADGGTRLNNIIEAIANQRRRYVLYYLRDEETATFEEILEQVAAWETGSPPEELDPQTKTNIRIDLYHAHLPKLEDVGIIEYDRLHESIRFQSLPDPIENVLDYHASFELAEIDE